MPGWIDRTADFFKSSRSLDQALRYNPYYYGPIRDVLRGLDEMDRSARRTLSDRLTQRTVVWASKLRGGLPRDVPLHEHPLIEQLQLGAHPERFTVAGLMRARAATSGTTGIPLKLKRSLRCIAAEQAFIDDILGVWNLTFRNARVARLRADAVKDVTNRKPPYGVYRESGQKLVLSSNHLGPQTAKWFHDELAQFKPDVLFTHPSSGEALARFMPQGRLLNIPLILTSSEMLNPAGRALMEGVFQATVLDYYGMAERVVWASSCAAENYVFNPAYGRVELLPVDDAEAPRDHCAFEIVATGFWNEAMPLVRYRSGDRVIVPDTYSAQDLEDVTLGLKPVKSIQGRDKEHLISPRGEVLVGLTHAANGVKGLARLQVIQERLDEIIVRVVADPRMGAVDETQLTRNLREFVPDDMRIWIRFGDEIERLPSGKTPFVIRRLPGA